MWTVLLIPLGYLAGSVSWAYLVARALRGIDIREVDTGIAGATNVFRHLGWLPGAVVFLGDLSKGVVPVALGRALHAPEPVVALSGVASMLGHWWPLFFGFRGGIGVSAALGATLVMMPLPTLVSAPVALVVLLWKRRMGAVVGTLFGLTITVALVWSAVTRQPPSPWFLGGVFAMAVAVLVRSLTWHHPGQVRGRR